MSTTAGLAPGTRTRGLRLRGALRTPSVAVPSAAGAISVVVTAVGSWIPSLWGDEAASALSAQRSLPSFIHEVTHVDAVHAVYYAALHVWIVVFGTSPFSLRFPSAIATGLMVAGVIVLTRLFTQSWQSPWRLSIVAGSIALLLPRLDYAGVEARGYSWTAAFGVWIAIVAVATLQRRLPLHIGWSWFAALVGVGTALNLYVGSLIFVIGCFAAVWAPREERALQLRSWAWASGTALVIASPIIVFGALEHNQVAFLETRAMPPSTWLISQWFFSTPFAVVGWLLLFAAVGVMVVRRDPVLDRGLGLLLVLWAGIPSAFLIGTISTLHNYSPRYLTFTAPAVAILMALAIEAVFRSWKPAGAVLLAGVLAGMVPSYVYERTPYAENESDWAQVGALIAANSHQGDQVAFDEVVRPSRRPENGWRVYAADYRNVTVPQVEVPYTEEATWHDKDMSIPEAAKSGLFTAPTVFLVDSDFPGEGVVDQSGVPALEGAGYHLVQRWDLHSNIVYRFDRTGAEGS